MNERTFLAVLVFPDRARDGVSVRVPRLGAQPPQLLRTSATFEGLPAIDVFRLADTGAWPTAAAYLYRETIPGTITGGGAVEQVALPDD